MMNKAVKQFVRDPLLHFLIAGLFLFFVFDRLNPSAPAKLDSKRIVVNEQIMIDYIQNRYGILDAQEARSRYHTFNEERKAQLVEEFIREEILAREALELGFHIDEFAVRSVLVDKMLFIASTLPEESLPKYEALKLHFENNKEAFFIVPKATFIHVYLDKQKHDPQEIERIALQTKDELNKQAVALNEAAKFGDPFPEGHYAMEWDYRNVERAFGKETADAIFTLSSGDEHWAGPFRSQQGLHLVKMINKIEGRYPELKEVMSEVRMHYREMLRRERVENQIAAFRNKYDVQINL